MTLLLPEDVDLDLPISTPGTLLDLSRRVARLEQVVRALRAREEARSFGGNELWLGGQRIA